MEKVVMPLEKYLFGKTVTDENMLRKAAHIFEHMMLSLGFCAYFRLQTEERGGKKPAWWFSAFSAGLLAALIDETIQLFSGRGSQVQDVWIDGIGVILGILLTLLIGYAVKSDPGQTVPGKGKKGK